MDLSSALSYPFKSIPKVLTIVIVITIGIAVFLAMLMNSYDWVEYFRWLENASYYDYTPALDPPGTDFFIGIFGLFVVLLAQGLWLSGYGVSVIRHVLEGFEKLPPIVFGRNIMDGLSVFFAGIWYGIVALPFLFGFFFLVGMFSTPDGEAGLGAVMLCGGMIAAIPLSLLHMWSFMIGMVRCAAEDKRGAMFEVLTNFRFARENWKTALSLTAYQFLVAIIFWFASQAISLALQFVTMPFVGYGTNTNNLLIVFVISMLGTYTIQIIQQFSSLHLMAQFAYNIGIMVGYEDEFDQF